MGPHLLTTKRRMGLGELALSLAMVVFGGPWGLSFLLPRWVEAHSHMGGRVAGRPCVNWACWLAFGPFHT